MIEQIHTAQERLVTAARIRKAHTQKTLTAYRTDSNHGWWRVYVMTTIFGITLFGIHFLNVSGFVQLVMYGGVVIVYYGFLMLWLWLSDAYTGGKSGY